MLGIRHDAGRSVLESKTRLTEAVAHVAATHASGLVAIGRATRSRRAGSCLFDGVNQALRRWPRRYRSIAASMGRERDALEEVVEPY